jgi:hypothetical protein
MRQKDSRLKQPLFKIACLILTLFLFFLSAACLISFAFFRDFFIHHSHSYGNILGVFGATDESDVRVQFAKARSVYCSSYARVFQAAFISLLFLLCSAFFNIAMS